MSNDLRRGEKRKKKYLYWEKKDLKDLTTLPALLILSKKTFSYFSQDI